MNDPNKNKGLLDKIVDLFFERDLRTVIIDTMRDIIVPAIKETFVNSVNNAANLLVGGGRSSYRPDDIRKRNREPGSRYHSGSRHEPGAIRLNSPKTADDIRGARMSKNMDRIWVESNARAQEIKDEILENFAEYDILTVSDVMDIAGIRDDNWAKSNWGWTDIDGDDIPVLFVPDNNRDYQWEIQLPRPHRID